MTGTRQSSKKQERSPEVKATHAREMLELAKELDFTKQELHSTNVRRMQEIPQPDGERKSPAGDNRTVYSFEMGKESAKKALENCRKISALVGKIDREISQELDKDIVISEGRLEKLSASSDQQLYDWYRQELDHLLNKAEQLGHLVLKQAIGERNEGR